MKLSDNTILVTGGGSGIGLALARELARHDGNTVIICGRNSQKLEAVHADYPAIATLVCDIARDAEQEHLVTTVLQNYPNLNILINNAGIQYSYDFSEGGKHADLIEEEANINFLSHAKLTDRLLPTLMQQQGAAIVNVTSALAVAPKQSAPIYCAAKAAMHSFTKALRYQLENTAVKVFEIIPPLVDTEMTKGRGKSKISPETLAKEALQGIEAGKYEIRIKKTKLLFALHRLSPSLAERIIRNG